MRSRCNLIPLRSSGNVLRVICVAANDVDEMRMTSINAVKSLALNFRKINSSLKILLAIIIQCMKIFIAGGNILMTRIICALIISVLMASSAFAGAIEAISLIDTRGQSDTDLLVNAPEVLKNQYYPGGKMPSQILAFYVKFGGQGVLFDAGLKDGHIAAQLRINGIKPEDVNTILITHLHGDHYGGLVDANGNATFPNAEVYVSEYETDYWFNVARNEPVISAMGLYGKRVHLFRWGDEVVPGVKAIDTAGHTPGHTAFLIECDGEKLIIAGDIMHFPEIQLPHPEIAVRYDVDPVKAVQSRKFLLDFAAWKNIPIAGMHITPHGIISVTKSGEGYVRQ